LVEATEVGHLDEPVDLQQTPEHEDNELSPEDQQSPAPYPAELTNATTLTSTWNLRLA
jgi:hypothetical protein